ncbi:MAG: ATP-binding protein [Deltaproteobacteria bacterium]|nr:ATP-binding protein [Deltaproteobacteria bacterium]MBI3294914.1 ATP-binding protein [Deltaproteobacteria bacterium]
MPLIQRNLLKLLNKTTKSILLLGPRQTGKSTFIESLSPDLSINLADERQYLRFTQSPNAIFQQVGNANQKTIFVDEVQRIPSLLNSIQTLIDDKKRDLRFLLTGSSARKLHRGSANLLPGRQMSFRMGPLVSSEIGHNMDSDQALAYGTLPGLYMEKKVFDREQLLLTYSATYLREEIQSEALTRNMEGFSRFLAVMASRATEFLDVGKFGSEAMINRETARRYFEILEDTLIIETIHPFSKSSRKRLVQHPRFFFFDNGVLNGLLQGFSVTNDRKGRLFENLLLTQLLHSARSLGKPIEISSYRTSHGAEVDFIVNWDSQIWAIEAKATAESAKVDSRGFSSFKKFYGKKHHAVVVTLGHNERLVDGIRVLPWQRLLKQMVL